VKKYTIGRLANDTGCKIPTIRYYESIGLLPEPNRSEGNTRLYGPPHQARLGFIQHCRELGFSQDDIRGLLTLTDRPESSCDEATRISKQHLHSVNQKIARLSALKAELEQMIDVCNGGVVGECRLVETLADHSHEHCLTKDHQTIVV
jgi:DNA-binding transcriptional MerR regulator